MVRECIPLGSDDNAVSTRAASANHTNPSICSTENEDGITIVYKNQHTFYNQEGLPCATVCCTENPSIIEESSTTKDTDTRRRG